MPITMLDTVDFSKIPVVNLIVPVVTSDPSPVAADEGRIIYNTTANVLKYCDGTQWVTLGVSGQAGPPNGNAGGDLSGTYPNPQIAAGVIVDADVNASAAIAQSKISGLGTSLSGKANTSTALTAGNGLTGGGDLSSNRQFDVGAGSGITVSADSIAVDTVWGDARYLPKAGGTLTGALVLAGNPGAPNEAANKAYVDLASQGFNFKAAVRVVAITNVALSGLQTIDGVTLVANNRVLVGNNTNPVENGIYIAAAGAWTRATDADASGELSDGSVVPVAQGTVGQDSQYLCISTSADPWVPGSSQSTWTRQSGLADLSAGTGLTKSGTTINFVAGDGTLTVAADDVRVASAPKWTTPRSFALTGDVTGSTPSVDGSGNVSIATTFVGGTNLAKHFAGDVPAGTACVINHNLATKDLVIDVFRNSSPWDSIGCTIERSDNDNITLRFAAAVSAGQYRVVVHGR